MKTLRKLALSLLLVMAAVLLMPGAKKAEAANAIDEWGCDRWIGVSTGQQFRDAFNDIQKGERLGISLSDDIVINENSGECLAFYIERTDGVVLNLNGHSILVDAENSDGLFFIEGSLRILDSSVMGTGYIDYVTDTPSAATMFELERMSASLSVYGGEFTIANQSGPAYNIFQTIGTLLIYDGRFLASARSGQTENALFLEIKDSPVKTRIESASFHVSQGAVYGTPVYISDKIDHEADPDLSVDVQIMTCSLSRSGENMNAPLVSVNGPTNLADVFYGGSIIDSKNDTVYNYCDPEDEHYGEDKILRGNYDFIYLNPVYDLFDDVDYTWFTDAVEYVYYHEIMTGKDYRVFDPYEAIPRAQFAKLLYNMAGSPAPGALPKYVDVPAGEWFSNAIAWASNNGIMTGYSDGKTFGLTDKLTRSQLAAILYRYALSNGYKMKEKSFADVSYFKDAGMIQSYAAEAMSWAVGNGIITGKDGGTRLDPNGSATRAETAVMIMKFMRKFDYIM